MKQYTYIIILLFSLLAACQDDLEQSVEDEYPSDGKTTFVLQASDASAIYTRSGDAETDEVFESVMLMGFDTDGNLSVEAYQQLIENNNTVRLYISGDVTEVYALCNVQDISILDDVKTLDDLKSVSVTMTQPDGAYTGKYVMSGKTSTDSGASSYTITVTRLAAKFDFNITFSPQNTGDQFMLSAIYMHNIPMGSKLLEPEDYACEKDSLNVKTVDYVYAADATNRADKYYKDKVWVDFEYVDESVTSSGMATNPYYSASYYLYENRQGGIKDIVENWENIKGLQTITEGAYPYKNLYQKYQQIYKRQHALEFKRTNDGVYDETTQNETGFQYASYLTIHGVYTNESGPYEVTYYVYLGKDNYKDFNVCRNHHYIYNITIYDMDKTDTRVISNGIGAIQVYGNFDEILDAHPNVLQALMYAQGDWTVNVENPDETPWLEVSKSARYIPRMAGEAASADKASFSMSGTGGLQYVYIHTDEYVPKINSPEENQLFQPRTGALVFKCGNVSQRVEIKQYPAQLVRLHIDYDIHLAKEINENFYVERVLEKKNMSWGFEHYWSFVTDDLIAAGQWDGLANTRRLYDVALNGDKWGVAPMYPADTYPNGIPQDIALGYAINKNRDRNGNGKIDYNEILWYLPAANEIQALSAHIYGEGAGDYYPEDDDIFETVTWDQDNGIFHTSSPSVADPDGITPGRSYYVTLSTGKKAIGLRSRYYNVLCARRADGWLGPETGETGGTVDNDEDWNDDEEEIMDKNKGE